MDSTDPQRWDKLTALFHAALELEGAERDAFLREAAPDDAMLAEIHSLLRADESAGSYMESPLELPAPLRHVGCLSAGDILCERFVVQNALGEGGMGEVYEAFDTELHVPVALKVVRSEIAAVPEAMARFRQEVRLARRITHPNVCRTFDLERDPGLARTPAAQRQPIVFLTMELLRGQTLAARLKQKGALDLDAALSIARQIAVALDAAHALGIVHRDMKPANVMLVDEEQGPPRAVVMDFGLARLDSIRRGADASVMTKTAAQMGTLPYMAPEQLQGAEVSPATDIYAFGLILYEMATGVRAFPSDDLLSGVTRRLVQAPPDPRAVTPNLPRAWCAAIGQCLEPQPALRPRSAAQVLALLEDRAGWPLRLRVARLRRRVRESRVAAAAVAVTLLLSLLGVGLRLYRVETAAKVTPGALVYMVDVRNETGERALDNLTALLQSGLSQSVQINLLAAGRVRDTLQQMTRSPEAPIDPDTAREIAMRTGAARVVFPTLSRSGDTYRLDVDVQQPDNTPRHYRHHWTRSFSWRAPATTDANATISPELLDAVRDASDWVRREVGESGNDIARLSVPPQDVTTANWAALEDFTAAQALINSGQKDAGIRRLRSATEQDPHFALAYAQLADNLMSELRDEESFAAYSKAVAFEQEGRLTARERYFIVGSHASDTGDFEVAVDAFKSYTDLYPNDYTGWFYLAYPLLELDRPDDALFALRKADALSPGSSSVKEVTAIAEVAAGRTGEAQRYGNDARLLGSGYPGIYASGIADFVAGRYDAAENEIAGLQQAADQSYRVVGFSLLADMQAERGRWEQAEATLEHGVTQSRSVGDQGNYRNLLLEKASVECRLQHYEDCLAAFDQAQEETVSAGHSLLASWVLGTAARAASPTIRESAVKRLRALDEAARTRPDGRTMHIARLRIKGELETGLGDWTKALEAFRAADRLDTPVADRAYLVRSLLSAAAHERDPAIASDLRAEAKTVFARTLAHPAFIWLTPWVYSPGIYADELEDASHLCSHDPAPDAACSAHAASLHALRGTGP